MICLLPLDHNIHRCQWSLPRCPHSVSPEATILLQALLLNSDFFKFCLTILFFKWPIFRISLNDFHPEITPTNKRYHNKRYDVWIVCERGNRICCPVLELTNRIFSLLLLWVLLSTRIKKETKISDFLYVFLITQHTNICVAWMVRENLSVSTISCGVTLSITYKHNSWGN